MSFLSKINIKKNSYLNLITALIPLSFIAGNMIININIIILIISSILIFKKEIFNIKFFLLDKLILLYFFLILFSGFSNDYYFYSLGYFWKSYYATSLKSILFIKYLLLYVVVRFLIEKNVISLKPFFIISTITVLFVSFDIFFQVFYGEDIFGYKPLGRKFSGPFGDELIAGGFIQRYSLFTFFLVPFFFSTSNFNKLNRFLIPVLFIIFFVALVLSGNRMPTLIFLFTIFLVLVFQKNTRKFLIPFLIIFSLTFAIILKSNELVRKNFLNMKGQVLQITSFVIQKDFFNEKSPLYLKEFSSFYHTWLMNKYVGGGIKNFRYYCHVRPYINKNSNYVCNMHPHNYYLEILTETGIIGFVLIISIFIIVLYLSLLRKYFFVSCLNKNKIIVPFIFLFIAEIFPLKSTGSFFTTGNATYLFLLIGIIIGLVRKENLIANRN